MSRAMPAAQPTARAPRPREADLIARWGAGAWRGWRLRADDGAHYTVIFQGRPGGPAGPDFRDAVLRGANDERIAGDIELHLSPAGWRAHGHGSDPRYNGLALHITLTAGRGDANAPGDTSRLASGRQVPLVVLAAQSAPTAPTLPPAAWPCADFSANTPRTAQRELLLEAGWARFEERVTLRAAGMGRWPPSAEAPPRWGADDAAFFVALAEGLGYGRDRAALRECGERLANGAAPDALLATMTRAGALERRRLVGLLTLFDRWRERGPIAALTQALEAGAARSGAAGAAGAGRALAEALTVAERGAVSPGRARILAFNVGLPALAAWARRQPGAESFAALALAVTEALPGLHSNQITREMTRQLGLPRLPSGALAQQGLHHLWAHHCREKRCEGCPCAGAGHAQMPALPSSRAFGRR